MITPIPSHDHGVKDDEDQTNDNHHPVDITTVATATTMTTSNTKTTTTLDDTQSKTVTTPTTVGTTSSSTTTTLVYIPSKEYAWLPARIISTTLNHSNPTKSGGKTNTNTSNSTSTRSTKTITVAVSIPQSSQDEQSLGLSSLQSHTLKEEIQTLLLPHDDDVLPLQNIVMDHTSIPKVEEEEDGGGRNSTVTRSTLQSTTLQIVTDLADLPFLHEVRRYCVCVCVCVGNEVYFIL